MMAAFIKHVLAVINKLQRSVLFFFIFYFFYLFFFFSFFNYLYFEI